MKKGLWIFSMAVLAGLFAACAKRPADYPIRPVPFTRVHIVDRFWSPRMETNRTVTIPHAFRKCEEEGRLDNFAIAGGLQSGTPRGDYPFDDTDVYKTMEGASYALMLKPDPGLDAYLDSVIALIAVAQEDDGYLYTVRTNRVERLKRWFGEKRWENEKGSHELYNAGHLFEAAAAHFQATGKRNLLDVALKLADLLDRTFGPGKLQLPPGHQVVEMGLVKLFRVTGESRYLNLAKFFLDVRGKPLDGRELWGEYNQDHEPVLEQDEAVGHAVRAGYMYSGMADVAALTGDRSFDRAVRRLWTNVAGKKLYLTGGIGAMGSNEGFSKNYDLPNMSAYNETCSSIGNVYWNHRLFLLSGESKYIDVMERTLYNALLSGISMDGSHFFYPNPLESVGQHQRSEWFGCACCPGNITRFIASVPGYAYAVGKGRVWVNLYAAGEAEIDCDGGRLRIVQETEYPWEGNVRLVVHPDSTIRRFAFHLRIPGWALGKPLATDLYRYEDDRPSEISLKVNGARQSLKMKDGYARLSRKWNDGDIVELNLPMAIRRVTAIDSVVADRGRVALERGPLVYCAERPDQADGHVRNLLLPDTSKLEASFRPELLGGIQVIKGPVLGFRTGEQEGSVDREIETLLAIPYYAWAHRGKGEMSVWLARTDSAVHPLGRPTLASTSRVLVSFGENPDAVHDGFEPAHSIDQEVPFFHWWPHKGTLEWIQYDFDKTEEVSSVDVYWFDDTGIGECRVPQSWRILSLEDGQWKPVWTTDSYGVEKDKYNRIVFETVRTRSIRLEIQSRKDWAGGIHEWRIR